MFNTYMFDTAADVVLGNLIAESVILIGFIMLFKENRERKKLHT